MIEEDKETLEMQLGSKRCSIHACGMYGRIIILLLGFIHHKNTEEAMKMWILASAAGHVGFASLHIFNMSGN